MAERDQEWRDLLSGSPVIRPVELWIRLGRDPTTFKGVGRGEIEQGLLLMGYREQAVDPRQTSGDRKVWVRAPWPSDMLWTDLSGDPILAAVAERYAALVVAKSVH